MITELLRPPSTQDRGVLSELFAPLGPERFFAEYWDVAPLRLSPGPDTARRQWLDVPSVVDIVTTAGVSAMDVRMARDGTQLEVDAYSSRAYHHDWSSTAILDPDRMLSLYDQGATILLESLDRYHLPTARRARAIEQCFGCTLKSNAFLTPAQCNAFPLHNDTYDGLIVQLRGTKHWDLYENETALPLRDQRFEPGRDQPGALLMSVDLEPGDLLYVPRGVIHRAEAIGEDSLHLTMIPVWPTWGELLDAQLRHAAHHDVQFRHGYRDDAFDEATLTNLLARLCGEDALAGGLGRLRDELVTTRRPLAADRWQDLHDRESVGPESTVRAREGVMVSLRRTGPDEVRIAWNTQRLSFPACLESALRRVLGGAAVRVSTLAESADQPAPVDAVRQLMSAGLLSLEPTS